MKNNSRSIYDSVGSTFKSKIHCTSGVVLTGYSKSRYANEGNDKVVVLEKWIIRLKESPKDYFNKENVEKIEFFLNKYGYENYCILTLTPTGFKLSNADFIKDDRLTSFLYAFYKNFSIKMQPHKPKLINEDKIFDLSKNSFKSMDELWLFCMKQVKNGFEEARIMQFYKDYSLKWLVN